MQWKILNGFMKAQDGVARWMHALVFMWPSGCFVDTWTKHMGIKMGRFGHPSTCPNGPRL